MSIKLAVLQDQDQVIAEIKEVVDEGKPISDNKQQKHIKQFKIYLTKKD